MTARVRWSEDVEQWLVICMACFHFDCHHDEASAELKAMIHNRRRHGAGKKSWRSKQEAA